MAAAAQGLDALPAASGLNLADLRPEDSAVSGCRNGTVCLAPPARTRLYELLGGSRRPGANLLPGRSEHLVRPGDLGLERVGLRANRGGW